MPILAAQLGDLPARQAREIPTVEDHLAGGRQLVADEQPQERRLAGAGRPDKEDELAFTQAEVHVVEGRLAVRVDLADAAQQRASGGPLPEVAVAASSAQWIERGGGPGDGGDRHVRSRLPPGRRSVRSVVPRPADRSAGRAAAYSTASVIGT